MKIKIMSLFSSQAWISLVKYPSCARCSASARFRSRRWRCCCRRLTKTSLPLSLSHTLHPRCFVPPRFPTPKKTPPTPPPSFPCLSAFPGAALLTFLCPYHRRSRRGPWCARRPGAAPRPGEVLKVFRDKAFGLRLGLCTFVMEN